VAEQAVKTAMCYRADGSLKWATWLPDGTALPAGITIEEGETFWPYVAYGRENDGRAFFVPVEAPIEGPVTTDA
jgi:hypothetical protein